MSKIYITENNLGTNWQKTNWISSELWPICQKGDAQETDAKTREFLHRYNFNSTNQLFQCLNGSLISYIHESKKKIQWPRVVDILLDHITIQNDRNTKVIDFQNVSPVMTCSVSDFVNSSISIWICALGCKGYLAPSEKKSSLSWRISLIIWGMLL